MDATPLGRTCPAPPSPWTLAVRLSLMSSVLIAVSAQPALSATAAGADSAARSVHPQVLWPKDGWHVGAGFALIGAASLLEVSIRSVPPQGLDPADIRWSFDREQIGRLNSQAIDPSDIASAVSVAYPMVLAFASQPSGERTRGTLRRSVVYLEAYLLATGTSKLIKNATDRPRPYTYVSVAQRPDDATYDVTESEAFESMPSSHASSSFCGAAFAMTDHLITRPHAGWVERVGVAFTGGLLASMTSTLRVRAGRVDDARTVSSHSAAARVDRADGTECPPRHSGRTVLVTTRVACTCASIAILRQRTHGRHARRARVPNSPPSVFPGRCRKRTPR